MSYFMKLSKLMRFIHHLFSGPFRVCIALMGLLGGAGYVHRSDYWGGDKMPISREKSTAATKRQKRWRRKRLKQNDEDA